MELTNSVNVEWPIKLNRNTFVTELKWICIKSVGFSFSQWVLLRPPLHIHTTDLPLPPIKQEQINPKKNKKISKQYQK